MPSLSDNASTQTTATTHHTIRLVSSSLMRSRTTSRGGFDEELRRTNTIQSFTLHA